MRELIARYLSTASHQTAAILDRSLQGRDLSEDEVVALFDATGADCWALLSCADYLSRETVGDEVSYVVNRNINFTNVCVKRCSFCAFSRTYRSDEGYYLPQEEIIRRAREAYEYGATEVCIQAGLAPAMEGDLYIRLCRAVKEALPELHIHAFSPEEILYGSQCSGMSIREYLSELKDAGIGSLPGTSAEILVEEVRNLISPGRITTSQWIDIIQTAHSLGIPTTSTIMYGHVETTRHCAQHLLLLRDLQRQSGGFTEFVPLSFVHTDTPMYADGLIKGVRAGASGMEVLKMHAVSRLVLNQDIPNIQVSWVKEGLKLSQACLAAGANDMGGTLINESISTSAGATHGQLVRPVDLRRVIRDAGRIPVERSTLYTVLHRFDTEKVAKLSPLDRLSDEETRRFGSYEQLTQMDRFRFQTPDKSPRKIAGSTTL
ncbi:5-amino-6-(D-ribitylamino)uracil--L-tyrosine 4-hydroxyphenyl transferase CofH [Acidobacteria bacterium AH-259-D05]|nr:5-amino-6-(D-ribitylamino)uracil--L-tyrosine 4-hydroxyphenyl transferase CofH [Acidobacteria bacterium AH-259-D05]